MRTCSKAQHSAGRSLLPLVETRLGLTPQHGAAFLGSYGEAVGNRWRSFGHALNLCCATDLHRGRAAEAATATFSALERWLCDAHPLKTAAVKFGEADLTTCDREPIHIPGSIQPHGCCWSWTARRWHIEQVAGDAGALLGISGRAARRNAPERRPGGGRGIFVASQLAAATENVAPVMRLNIRSRAGTKLLDLTLHAVGRTAIVELEPVRSARPVGDHRSDHRSDCQAEALLSAVHMTASVKECCDAAAMSLRKATGFDRAMVYRFLPDDSGEVVAEDAREGLESFLGLHYPASDIPQQARELYRRNWLRTIPDINYARSAADAGDEPAHRRRRST